tara:strand:- start:137 stop:781 length:645 start_codon:yes stop_codon:yes gene_type:complete
MINLTLLVEESKPEIQTKAKTASLDKKKDNKSDSSDDSSDRADPSLDTVFYGSHHSPGRPKNSIKDSTSRAQIEPQNLLNDLGIKDLSGSSSIEKFGHALQQAVKNNKIFGGSFSKPKIIKDKLDAVVLIEPYVNKTGYPHIYIGAIMLALQNVGALPKSLESEVRGSELLKNKSKANIRQDNKGTIVIANPEWHASRPRVKRSDTKRAKRKDQ